MAHGKSASVKAIRSEFKTINPVMTIGRQIAEPLRIHRSMSYSAGRKRAIEIMKLVGIPGAESRVDNYPHQFSGGMRQRVMIAMALSCDPKILIADEPTTALDFTVQDQILKLILKLRNDIGMSVLLVTHDIGVIAQTCDRVAVMYAGKIVESGATAQVVSRPAHPYTRALLAAPTSSIATLTPYLRELPSERASAA